MVMVRAFARRRRWTPEEEEILRREYAQSSRSQLLGLLPHRKIRNIETKAHLMGLSKVKKPARTPDQVREAKRLNMAKKRMKDPEAVRAYQRDNYHKNRESRREAVRAYQARRFFWMRAIKLSGVTAESLASLWKSQRGRCGISGRRLTRDNAQIDHIVPRAKGGDDRLSNLRWACAEANIAKRDMTDEELARLCEDILDRIRISWEMGR